MTPKKKEQKRAIFKAIDIKCENHNWPDPDNSFMIEFVLKIVSKKMNKRTLVNIDEIGTVILKKLEKIKVKNYKL